MADNTTDFSGADPPPEPWTALDARSKPPSPLGWCAWHLGCDEAVAALTVYDGAALCAECHDDSMRQDGEHAETAGEERRRTTADAPHVIATLLHRDVIPGPAA